VNKIASLTIALALGCAGMAMAQDERPLTQQDVVAQLIDAQSGRIIGTN